MAIVKILIDEDGATIITPPLSPMPEPVAPLYISRDTCFVEALEELLPLLGFDIEME